MEMNFDEIIELSLADDDIEFPTKGTYNRASRRKAKEHKKNALGQKIRHSNEWINGYITSKGKDGKKSTRWIKDIIKENAWDEFDSIDWSRVKGINPKNCGYKQYNKRPELIKSRYNAREICRKYSDADDRAINKAWAEYYRDMEDRWIDEDDYESICNPWGYTEEERREIDTYHFHGDFDHVATEMIYEDYHNPGYLDDDDYEYYGYDPYQSAIDDREEAWDTIADLRREIARYKDFLGEFNLNTLYERWLADNNS